VPVEQTASSATPQLVTAAEIAEAAGAADLFVFRRVSGRRFAHIGGAGRGAGWAGIIEIGVDEEPLVEAALSVRSVVRRSEPEAWHVLGPYYAHSVAAVPVSGDVFVVFGSSSDGVHSASDGDLFELARFASDALVEVAPAKRLADELEALNAVRDLLHAQAETFDDALRHLVDQATLALSCDLGLIYVGELRRILISDRTGQPPLDEAEVAEALSTIAERGTFPLCIQEAAADELPPPFRSTNGVLAYYLLEVKQPLPGVLLLLHTTAGAPRGFTLLCQSLGRRLTEAAEPLLAAALLRDTMREELERAAAEARRDPLTGLANRLAWNEALSGTSACAVSPSSVVQIDCRGLKQINDTAGHHVGDRLLCRVATVLSSGVREGDLVARLGGDEFGILLCDADEEMARTIVARIEAALESGIEPGEPEIRLAVGTSTSRDDDLEAAQLRADAELLEAKRSLRAVSNHPASS
jgi:diguanylate cyclase (GGDEF)-like protein